VALLLHLSDLHTGSPDPDAAAVESELRRLVGELDPELVVASGDLTHRNRTEQHARAAALLRSLGPPVLAVPGNHDIPALPPARLLRPHGAFLACWGTITPVQRTASFVVAGMCTVRPWLYQEGGLAARAARGAAEVFAGAPSSALRVAVIHHHVLSAPWRSRKLPVVRRARALEALRAAGTEVVLSGHTHQAAVGHPGEFEIGASGPVLVNAPGFGRPRPGRRGETRGVGTIAVDGGTIAVTTYLWRGGFEPVAERRFARAWPEGTQLDHTRRRSGAGSLG
jgi:3',5'-cyclic AMP phosphodiesterase CpdA